MRGKMKENGKKGAITVEAVMILPLYILVILFLINFMNITYTQLTVQQGLNNAGRMLAQYGYAMDVAVGLENLNDTADVDTFEESTKTVFQSLLSVPGLTQLHLALLFLCLELLQCF